MIYLKVNQPMILEKNMKFIFTLFECWCDIRLNELGLVCECGNFYYLFHALHVVEIFLCLDLYKFWKNASTLTNVMSIQNILPQKDI